MEGPGSLRETLIRQTEQSIDGLRKRKALLDQELAEIEPQIEEARALLQMIKTGKVSESNSRRTPLKMDDVMDIFVDMPDEFTTYEMAETLGSTNNTASTWCRRLMNEGLLLRTVVGRGGIPSTWVKVNG